MFRKSSFLLAVVATIASGYWVDLSAWMKVNQGLIAFLGLISAAIFQVIPVTANFLQQDELTPMEAERLTQALNRQQSFWVGYLAIAMFAFVVLVTASVLQGHLTLLVPVLGPIDVSMVFSALIGGPLAFMVLRMPSLLGGVLGLQRLRSSLVVAAAKRRASEKAKLLQATLQPSADMVPEHYGAIEPLQRH